MHSAVRRAVYTESKRLGRWIIQQGRRRLELDAEQRIGTSASDVVDRLVDTDRRSRPREHLRDENL